MQKETTATKIIPHFKGNLINEPDNYR